MKTDIKVFKVNGKYKIMIVPGGGMFGYISNHFLAQIEADLSPVCAYGGASIGGILSLAYACGETPKDLDTGFHTMGNEIFQYHFWRRISPWGAKYASGDLKKQVENVVTGKYGDLKNIVIVPVLNFKKMKCKVYDNIVMHDDIDLDAWEIGVATASAPTYFDPWKVYIDGGLLENMPIMTTVTALKDKLDIPYSEMDVLVVGNGSYRREDVDMGDVSRWTGLDWLSPMIKILTKANEMMSHKYAQNLGLNYYKKFDPVILEPNWDMDDPSLINVMAEKCKDHISEFKNVYDEFIGGNVSNG